MEVRTYRAKSLQQALELVRRDLGPSAAVLHTRQLRTGLWGRLSGAPRFEITATDQLHIPSRVKTGGPPPAAGPGATAGLGPTRRSVEPAERHDYRGQLRDQLKDERADAFSLIDHLCQQAGQPTTAELPQPLFQLFTHLLDLEIDQGTARQLIELVRQQATTAEWRDPDALVGCLARQLQSELRTSGPIAVQPGCCRVVALVGPTGVGKTTTIAKLAGNLHLKEHHRVGLITVDTYRIAAVDQLRTYAEIIDLPMEVVASPREMREAVARLSDLDVVFIDTAGRSPRDEVRLQELKGLLAEAAADEVHLVLSAVAGLEHQRQTIAKFSRIGLSSLLLTKLDEVLGLGSLVSLLREQKLPVSYLTDGQSVPDDIQVADAGQIVSALLGTTASK